jgi:hypothetical protein
MATEVSMEIPGLGAVGEPDAFGWRHSEPMPVAVLRGGICRVVLDGYDDDSRKAEFHDAITNFLAADVTVLQASAGHIFRYYLDCNADWDPGDDGYVAIRSPDEIWDHIRLGGEAMVSRRPHGDMAVYVSLECECDWEPEHGLQIVFRKGLTVNKVGPYDGHLTNSDSFADDALEHVIYKAL